jgi:hypothetical protein
MGRAVPHPPPPMASWPVRGHIHFYTFRVLLPGGGGCSALLLCPGDKLFCYDSGLLGCDALLTGNLTVEGDGTVFFRNVGNY